MKRILLASALLCFATAAFAQTKTADGRISTHDVHSSVANGKVNVSMQIDATKALLHRTEAIALTPVIKSGDNERALTPVIVSGKNRKKADHRAARFNRPLRYNVADMHVKPGVIPYTASTAFEAWMSGAEVVLREDVYGCNHIHSSVPAVSLLKMRPAEPVKPSARPTITYITPQAEAVKNREHSGTAFLEFQTGRSTILRDFRGNAAELDKIRKDIERIRANKDFTGKGITLRGFASPEGSYASNERLSKSRAEALRAYLEKQYTYTAKMYSVSSVAEDWDGLKAAVEKSTLASRAAILEIIASADQPDVKERKLKALPDYKQMLTEIFPKLRRVDYRMDYTVRSFSVDEGKSKVMSDPGQLSLNEMFLVANSYPKGSDQFKQVFDVAVRMYPNDPVANINAGAMLLERGDYAGAKRYLEPYASSPQAWNNLGVLYLLEGDYAKAKGFLDKAAQSAEGKANLGLLGQWESYVKAKKSFDAFLK